MTNLRIVLGGLLITCGLIVSSDFIQAQVATVQPQTVSGGATPSDGLPDSPVRIAAEAAGLSLVSPDQISVEGGGVFFIVTGDQFPTPWPFLPIQYRIDAAIYSLDSTGQSFLVDGTTVSNGMSAADLEAEGLMVLDFVAVLQTMQANAAQAAALNAKPISSSGGMETMDSLINGSGGAPVYLTNLINTPTNGSTMVTFSIAGGTNGFAYDIYSTTNLANSPVYSQWTWLGQGFTSNSYTFTNQPVDQAFYVMAIPRQTMVVAWGDDSDGECDVPPGLTNAIDIAGGYYDFSLALKADGTVVAWGDNTYGECNVPDGLTNVTGIAAGGAHVLALLQNGTVVAWGANGHGQTNVPAGLTNVTAIAAGNACSLALRNDGTVVAWGYNGFGQTNVPALGPVTQIAAGVVHSAALLADGTVTVWGYNGSGFGWNTTNVPAGLSNVVSIAAGAYHTLALKADSTVTAWGAGGTNTGGQIENYGQSIVPSGLSNVVAIAAGGVLSLALKADGTVVAWGDNTFGQKNLPDGLTGVKAIAAGGIHGLAIRSGQLMPLILQQPVNQCAQPGDTVSFSAKGEGFADVQYQWQFNGVDISGATNATLTLTNVSSADEGSYRVVISDSAGAVTSIALTFAILQPPQIVSTTPALGTIWITSVPHIVVQIPLTVMATDGDPVKYPLSYQWSLNGTNIPEANISEYLLNIYYDSWAYDAPLEGNYAVTVTNAAGSTNVGTWNIRVLLSGMVAAWGANDDGECDRPVTLTNATALAAGLEHSVAVRENGTIVQWGDYQPDDFQSPQTPVPVGDPPTDSNIVAVAAGMAHDLALKADGTVMQWGLTGAGGLENFPTNLAGVKAIGTGYERSLALLTNGSVVDWGYFIPILGLDKRVPGDLTNAIAIACGAYHCLAVRGDGTVTSWGYNESGQTNVPAGLSNVVAVAGGERHSLALKADGTVAAWGDDTYGQCDVPAGLSNVMAIAAGHFHNVALKNDGTVVSWGDNSKGQTNVPDTLSQIKLIAAGGDHSLAVMFSPTVQYPVDVTKDLLLIYNTNSTDSTTVLNYYLAHRPMVSGANVLGIGCSMNEAVQPAEYTNTIAAPVQSWLAANPTLRPSYVILFPDIPSQVVSDSETSVCGFTADNDAHKTECVPYRLNSECASAWSPFVTSINMNGTNDCIGYINKLASFGTNYSPGKLVISASAGGYGNTNYIVDDAEGYAGYSSYVTNAVTGLLQNGISMAAIIYASRGQSHISQATNVAGYISWGNNGGMGANYYTNVFYYGNSGWYPIMTIESFNGQRCDPGQGTFLKWFSPNAFGGTNYSNTPIGAVTHVLEPYLPGVNASYTYFGLWAAGKHFAICAWNSRRTEFFQAVGDPFVTK